MMFRRWIFVMAAMVMLDAAAFSQAAPRPRQLRPNAVRPGGPAVPPVEELVEGFYVSRIQAEVDLTDEQFVKLLPVLRQSFRERRAAAARQIQAMAELRRLAQAGAATEDELKSQIREVDRSDADFVAAEQKLIQSVDAILTPRQQARFRVFRVQIDQRIRQMIANARNPRPPGPFPQDFR